MQPHNVQNWRGCSETISLSQMTAPEIRTTTPELSEEAPLILGVPPAEQINRWQPGAALEVSIARIQERSLPTPSLSAVHMADHAVADAASEIGMSADLRPDGRPSLSLWEDLVAAQQLDPGFLRVSPEAPTEVKCRIWIQPMEEPALHRLDRAGERSCPLVATPGLEALKAALEHSTSAGEPSFPAAEGFAARGLVARDGMPLQSIAPLRRGEAEPLLYPGSRRIPIPATYITG